MKLSSLMKSLMMVSSTSLMSTRILNSFSLTKYCASRQAYPFS